MYALIDMCCISLHDIVCLCYRKLESKKKRLVQMEEQLQKLEVQATDKVCVCV